MNREQGIQVLRTCLHSDKNVSILEKYVYECTEDPEEYMDVLYECVDALYTSEMKKSETVKRLVTDLYRHTFQWNHPVFDTFHRQMEEENEFILNPIEIEEGVLECKCGSKRTISFQRQTRSADEGSTTFAQCVECGAKWRHNN